MGFADNLLAGVADAGHARVAAQRAVFTRLNAVQDGLAVMERMLIVADHRLFQPQMVQQTQRDTGVLGRDEIRHAESGCHAGRHIVQIADGSSDKI